MSAFWSGAQSGTADAVDVRHRMAAPAGRTLVLRMTVGGLLGLGRLLRPANPVLWILPHAVEVHARVKTARRAPVCLGVRVLLGSIKSAARVRRQRVYPIVSGIDAPVANDRLPPTPPTSPFHTICRASPSLSEAQLCWR